MTHDAESRNDPAGSNRWAERFLDFIDRHPRVGWYIAACATLNVVLNVLDLLH